MNADPSMPIEATREVDPNNLAAGRGSAAGSSSLPPRRNKETRRSVIIADMTADWVIRVGGVGVIVAVFAIMFFLVQSVVPLFTGGSVGARFDQKAPVGASAPVFERIDEQKIISIRVGLDGSVIAYHVPTGKQLKSIPLDFGGTTATAMGRSLAGSDLAFGFSDGTMRLARLEIDTVLVPAANLPADLVQLDARDRISDGAVYAPAPDNQFRRIDVRATLDAPQQITGGAAIVQLDIRTGGTEERPSRAFAVLDAEGNIKVGLAEQRKNIMTGAVTTRLSSADLPALPAGFEPVGLLVTSTVDQVYVGGRDGRIARFDSRDLKQSKLAEIARALPQGVNLTALAFHNGQQSLLVGGSDGSVDIFFRLPREGATTTDGRELIRAHKLEAHKGAVIGFVPSQRSKIFATADASGQLWLRHSTSEQTLLRLEWPSKEKLSTVVLSPRDDALLISAEDGSYHAWPIDVPHPETTLASIFGKVWYEGYPRPDFTWQSSSGTDAFEPKFSLMPLIFGTIKAAIYSLLFAVPVAVGAAIYTSEFLHPRVRAVVKPAMEMMASLPSVVLGFIAALILAPIVENWLAAVILAGMLAPLALFLSAFSWQLLPMPTALRYGGLPKFTLMFCALGLAMLLSYAGAGAFERIVFAGDVKAWANGNVGSDVPFLSLVLLPLVFFLVSAIYDRTIGDRVTDWVSAQTRFIGGLGDIARWGAIVCISLAVAVPLAAGMTAVDLGIRNGLVGTYVQRNTLVVGFAMAFAVIPIIYTIAEDALNSVPEHLRAASLACGGTTWQTATRIIVPAAMSGIFAAIMVGLGRAVGETMIVVMAAGNTPVMDWNVFNGLRALSANIAVELPEAVRDDTLYRMLFLAALVLFAITFVLNTLAESIRQRFRKRAAQL